MKILIGLFRQHARFERKFVGQSDISRIIEANRELALDAYANQELPFEKLVEELNPERSLSYAPIFQVMFALQNSASSEENFADLKSSRVKLPGRTAKYDLSLDVFVEADELELQLEYDVDLFAEKTVHQMLEHFRTILEAVVTNPEQRVTNVPILTEPERHQMLVEWNDYDAEVPPVCIHKLIETHAEKTPDATAAVWKNERISYGDLNRKANQLAHFLKKQGVQPESVVGVYVERSLEMIIGVLGVLKAGGAYLPLDSNYPAERLQHMTQRCREFRY